MIITLLGTGTPSPSLKRQSSGYLIETGGDTLVFDHGPGAHHRLLESGHQAIAITHAFFSHLHYDHCIDYPRLVLQRWDQGADRIPDLQVFGPPPLARMTEQLFGEEGVYGPDIRARIEHQSSIDVFRARGGTPPRRRPAPRVREVHARRHRQRQWVDDARGARVARAAVSDVSGISAGFAEGSVCYSGDSGLCDEIVELARGADVLIQMNQYFSGMEESSAYRAACGNHRDNALIASRAGVGTLVLTHLLEEIDRPSVREQILEEIREVFDGDVIWGEDLMRITVPVPSTI